MSHSRKILGQAGRSLADVYDVEGSVVGLENLDVGDIKGVHELGAQIHSERLQSFLVLASSTALGQSTAWGITTGGFPDSINRLLGVTLIADAAGRVGQASIAIQEQGNSREIPIAVWATANDREQLMNWSFDGAAVALVVHLSTLVTHVPQLLTRLGTSRQMPQLIFRGNTAAFGAGTVTTRALYHLARPSTGNPAAGEPSSHGLPIPGW